MLPGTGSRSLGGALRVSPCVALGRPVPPSGPQFPRWFTLLVVWFGNAKASGPLRRLQSMSGGLWRPGLGPGVRRTVQPNLEDLDPTLRGWLLCFRNKKLEVWEDGLEQAEWTGRG